MLGFLAASVIATIYVSSVGSQASAANIATVNDLRTWFLIFAFVSIGLEFNAASVRAFGWRPVVAFGAATIANLVIGLGLSLLLFGSFVF